MNPMLMQKVIFFPSIWVKFSEAEMIQKLALNQEWKWKQLTVETRIFILFAFFPKSWNRDL